MTNTIDKVLGFSELTLCNLVGKTYDDVEVIAYDR